MTGAAQVARRENHCVNQIAGQILPGEYLVKKLLKSSAAFLLLYGMHQSI
jgi:hypothetical protein